MGSRPLVLVAARSLALFLAFAASPACAERFTVAARVTCPTSMVASPVGPVADPTFSQMQRMPCAGMRVTVRDSDPLWDEYCGSAYTNSRGEVRFDAECSDFSGRPSVYLEVEARSALGFSVGTHHLSFFEALWFGIESLVGLATGGALLPVAAIDFLTSHKTLSWVSPERQLPRPGEILDFGEQKIGGIFNGDRSASRTTSEFAAHQFWITHYSKLKFDAGMSGRMMDFNYSVDAPLGHPTTLYDTVVVDEELFLKRHNDMLNATPHEMGHLLYNGLHSDFVHWLTDAPDYMTTHAQCEDGHFQTLAWYEGFGNFMRDYVYQTWDWANGDWTPTYRPSHGCARNAAGALAPDLGGLQLEGNVQGILNGVFYGPVREVQRAAVGRIVEADWVCPAGAPRVVTAGQPVKCRVTTPAVCPSRYFRAGMTCIYDSDFLQPEGCIRNHTCFPRRISLPCNGGTLRNAASGPVCVRLVGATLPGLDGGSANARPDGSPASTLGIGTAGKRWFSLPRLDTVLGWISAERISGGSTIDQAHRLNQFWSRQIRPWCEGYLASMPGGSTPPPYCDRRASRTFDDEWGMVLGGIP